MIAPRKTIKVVTLIIARRILKFAKVARNMIKRRSLVGRNTSIHPTVSICWSVSIDPARGVISVGKNSGLDIGVVLRAYGGSIKIGENCTINPYSVLYGAGGLSIGNGVRIAAHSVIVASNHIFSDPDVFIYAQGDSRQGIVIEDDVWIGAGAKVLDGVTVSKGTVIAAGAVVTKSTEPYSVVAGVPAKKISTRIPCNQQLININ